MRWLRAAAVLVLLVIGLGVGVGMGAEAASAAPTGPTAPTAPVSPHAPTTPSGAPAAGHGDGSTSPDVSVNIGGSNGGPTEISNADSALVATWNRALNRDEIALLDRDPYVLVRPALRRAGRRGVLATLRRISPQWLWID